jgi:hypothetical protein
MPTALEIINDGYARLNRLSPGETLGADEAAFGFTRLNLLVDHLSAKRQFLFRSVLTSAAQTGNITLAAGSWAAIPVGTKIISATANNEPLTPITMQQYNELYDTTTAGQPLVWAQDGLSNVYFVPVPSGETIKLQTQVGVATFADQTTNYTMPQGYQDALGAMLAARLAPTVLGSVPASVEREARAGAMAVGVHVPMIVDVHSYTKRSEHSRILTG